MTANLRGTRAEPPLPRTPSAGRRPCHRWNRARPRVAPRARMAGASLLRCRTCHRVRCCRGRATPCFDMSGTTTATGGSCRRRRHRGRTRWRRVVGSSHPSCLRYTGCAALAGCSSGTAAGAEAYRITVTIGPSPPSADCCGRLRAFVVAPVRCWSLAPESAFAGNSSPIASTSATILPSGR